MSKIFNILTMIIQIAWTFILMLIIYMTLALFDSDFGIDGLFGLLIVQPIFGIILSILTIGVCLLVGLPIRLNKNIRSWWTTNFYISFIGIILGLILLFLSLSSLFTETVEIQLDGQETLKSIPNPILTYIGWFLTAFMSLHIFPAKITAEKIEAKLNSIKKRKTV